MPAKLTVPCDACNSTGTVPHQKRMIGPPGEMVEDKADFKLLDICEKCGGGGRMPAGPPPSTG